MDCSERLAWVTNYARKGAQRLAWDDSVEILESLFYLKRVVATQ
jgi:hypothetical protein